MPAISTTGSSRRARAPKRHPALEKADQVSNSPKKPLRSEAWFARQDKMGFYYRSFLKNCGFPQDQFEGRPVIGICNIWSELGGERGGERGGEGGGERGRGGRGGRRGRGEGEGRGVGGGEGRGERGGGEEGEGGGGRERKEEREREGGRVGERGGEGGQPLQRAFPDHRRACPLRRARCRRLPARVPGLLAGRGDDATDCDALPQPRCHGC